ncbi:beta strand repeat-containing protein [Blastopirellula marina]|uniref:Cadherin n=1 Tax=Blastopirellula marina TaxID=124 RepID=A0A2S8GJR6_9BACT|nr:cadherin domain-containing protein [Blastopirellula marina]PQO44689.1 hypothetical protein C5Y93_18165 [Blastopirellula marina]
MKNTDRTREKNRKLRKQGRNRRRQAHSQLASERLEIRDLLALTTIDLVEDLTIAEGTHRDITLDHISGASSVLVGLKISGTGGNFDPGVPLIHLKDNPSAVITPVSAMANVNGTTDSLVFFEMGTATLTIEVGGTGGGEFQAEIFLFGDSNGDRQITENEYMQASASQIQGAGTGNANTAMYYKSVWGIDLNQSQYDYEFDLNQDGKVDANELNWVQKNQAASGVFLDLIGDIDPPTISIGLVTDTSADGFPGGTTDGITSEIPATTTEAAIRGTVTDFSNITSVVISGTAGSVNVFSHTIAESNTADVRNVTFGLSLDDLQTLFGTDVTDGSSYTLNVNATDDLGNTYTTPISFTFQFDTTDPAAPTVDLVASSDTGDSNTDNLTKASTLTFEVATEAGSIVELFVNNTSVGKVLDAANAGQVAFNLTSEFAVAGVYEITAKTYDAAGNESGLSSTLEVTVDRTTGAPVITLTNPSGDAGASATRTDDDNADFSIAIEKGATVTIGGQSATDADLDGIVVINDIALTPGSNSFTAKVTDVAGNTASTPIVIVSNKTPVIDSTSLDAASNLFETTSFNLNTATILDAKILLESSSADTGETLSFAASNVQAILFGGGTVSLTNVTVTVTTGPTGATVTIADPNGELDYEAGIRQLSFDVTVTDNLGDGFGNGGLTSATQNFIVDVSPLNESPVIAAGPYSFSINEDDTDSSFAGATPLAGNVTDPEVDDPNQTQTLTYSLSGTDSSLFDINSSTGEITIASGATFDYETTKSYALTVTVTDDGTGMKSASTTVTVNVNDVNETPEMDAPSYSFTIEELADGSATSVGSEVGTVSATDPDAADDSPTPTNPDFADLIYTLSGTGSENFEIDADGKITVASGAVLDFETTSVYNLTVTATDKAGAGLTSVLSTVEITLTDFNETPSLDDPSYTGSVNENSLAGTVVAVTPTIDATDPDDADGQNLETLTYSFAGGGLTSGPFTIDATDGTITVTADNTLDFETKSSYTVSVVVSDGVNTSDPVDVVISLVDINEAPVLNQTSYTISELLLQTSGDTTLNLNFTDPENGTVTFVNTTPMETGDAYFSIESDGSISYTNGPVPPGSYELSFTGTDDGSPAQMFSGTITINVVDNLPPIVDDNDFDVAENQADDTIAFTLTFSEQNNETDGIASVTLQNNAGGAFRLGTLSGNSIDVIIDDTTLIDFENNPTMSITVRVTDGVGSFADYVITIHVTDTNDAPVYGGGLTFAVDEYVAAAPPTAGTPADDSDVSPALDLSTAFTDQDASDMGNLVFSIDPASDPTGIFAVVGNKVVVATPSVLDADAGPTSYVITVQAFDGDVTTSQNITINVTPRNELPLPLDGSDMPLVATAGVIDLGTLNVLYDDLTNSMGAALPNGLDLFSILNIDADPEMDEISYLQTGGSANFDLGTDGSITLAGVIAEPTTDFDDYLITFTYQDDNANQLTSADVGITSVQFTLRVLKNIPPVITPSSTSGTIAENTVSGTQLAGVTLTLTDADVQDTILTPTLSGAFSDAFELVESPADSDVYIIQVANSSKLDYEAVRAVNADGKIFLTVNVSDDRGGAATPVIIEVTVTDVNEAPTMDAPSYSFSIDEIAAGSSTGENSPVGTVSATDPDAADDGVMPASDAAFSTLTYTLSGTGSENFYVDANGNIKVAAGASLDAEVTSQYDLTVVAKDGEGLATGSSTVTITIDNVNEAPVATGVNSTITIDESKFDGTDTHYQGDIDFDGNTTSSADDGFELRYAVSELVDNNGNPLFTDVDSANLTLKISSSDLGQSAKSIEIFDNGTPNDISDDVVIAKFLHYQPSLSRADSTITVTAYDGALDSVASADITFEYAVKNIIDVQIRAVKELSSFDGTGTDVKIGDLPQSTANVLVDADGLDNTFYYEVWVSVNYGADQAAPGRVYFDGPAFMVLNMTYNTDALGLQTDPNNSNTLLEPTVLTASGMISDNGNVSQLGAIVGMLGIYTDINTDPNSGTTSSGNGKFAFSNVDAGDYIRFATIPFQLADNVTVDGQLEDLIQIDFVNDYNGVSGNYGATKMLLDAAGSDQESTPVLKGADLLAGSIVNPDTYNVDTPAMEIITDFLVFNLASSTVNLDLTTSKLGTGMFTAQGANNSGAQANLTGNLYVQILDADGTGAQVRIVGADLTVSTQGSYLPGTDASTPTSGNFGLTANTTNLAMREMSMQLSTPIVIDVSGDIYSASGTFDPSNVDFVLDGGKLQTATPNGFGGFTSTSDSLIGNEVTSVGAESGTVQATNGGNDSDFTNDNITITFNLDRMLANQALPGFGGAIFQLFADATITANYGGGVPLTGTVYANGGQPLEEGSGVFASVVKSPTALDSSGQIDALPVNETWLSEWDGFWVEVWANTADAAGILGGTVDLKYNTDLFSATKIEYASKFTQDRTGTINDLTGMVLNLGSGTDVDGLGKDGFVLLGRVKFESLTGDGLSIEDGLQFGPESLGLEIVRGELELADAGLIRAAFGANPDVDVWAVPYDLDNDGTISLVDLSTLVRRIGTTSIAVEDALTAATDFDNDGQTSLIDLSQLIRNLGISKANASSIQYPTSFTQLWVGAGLITSGPDSLEAIFDAANAAWADALGLDEPLDVRLEVTNLGGAQLGEAKLVALDGDGLPFRGVLTIDDDGAGFGWSTDLENGPSSGQYDLYTVMLHELGHLYGFMPQYSAFAEHVSVTPDMTIFIGDMWAVEMDARGEHLDADTYTYDIMSPYLAPGIRKEISELDVQMILTAYGSADASTTISAYGAALTEQSAAGVVTPVDVVSPVSEVTTLEAESTQSPVSFVLGDNVANLADVSGRTGVAVVMPETTRRTLEQSGISFKTLSDYSAAEFETVSEVMTDVDTYFDDTNLIESTISDIESDADDADGESVDDLFAEWDEIEMA